MSFHIFFSTVTITSCFISILLPINLQQFIQIHRTTANSTRTMAFTAAQRTSFWTQQGQMCLPAATLPALTAEGISQPDDLEEFNDAGIKAIAKTIREEGHVFAQKSVQRIQHAAKVVRYYHLVGRALTPANMRYTVIKKFISAWESLEKQQEKDAPDTPKITKNLPIMHWSQAFKDTLSRVIGVRYIPLSYVVREVATPAGPVPEAKAGEVYAEAYDSIKKEMIALANHTDPLYEEDNAEVYFKVEEATRGTQYAASIKPFSHNENGRGAFLALLSQHAGKAKWTSVITQMSNLLLTVKWKGQGNYPLEKHIAKHRDAFEQLTSASVHVEYQLPNEYTRVTQLLESIECGDAVLQAKMANIESNEDVDGPRYSFEKAAEILTPADPVAKRLASQKRPHGSISGAEADDGSTKPSASISSLNIKSGKGPKTGVDLRWHTLKEFKTLSQPEKDELADWRGTPEGKKGR